MSRSKLGSTKMEPQRSLSFAEVLKTGIIYEESMADFHCLWSEHVECPERFTETLKKCKQHNLINRCVKLHPRQASEEELKLVHTEEHIEVLKKTKGVKNVKLLQDYSKKFDSVYFHPKTYDAALYSAGCAIELVSAVMQGVIQNGAALIRPPGHHAMTDAACGFCFFNNVAVAAKFAITQFSLERVLIVDWDVHHGQATQDTFYDDPRVLYFSTHRYEEGTFWPNLRESDYDHIGSKEGTGFNFNIPLNETKLKGSDYLAIWNNVLLPVAYEYSPQLILISAGFDCAEGCDVGEMNVAPPVFGHFVNSLSGLAYGKICLLMEGGYCVESLSESFVNCLKVLLGDPCLPISSQPPPSESVKETILNIISVQRPFWKSLRFQGLADIKDSNIDDLHIATIDYKGSSSYKQPTKYYIDIDSDEPSDYMDSIVEKLGKLAINSDPDITKHRTSLAISNPPPQNEYIQGMISIFERHAPPQLLERFLMLSPKSFEDEELFQIPVMDNVLKVSIPHESQLKFKSYLSQSVVSENLDAEGHEDVKMAFGSVFNVLHSVLTGVSQNGVIILNSSLRKEKEDYLSTCIHSGIKYAWDICSVDKIFVVDFSSSYPSSTLQELCSTNAERLLYITLPLMNPSQRDENSSLPDNMMYFDWKDQYIEDGDLMAVMFHFLLPIAYQYDPSLIIITFGDCGYKNTKIEVDPITFSHFTHLFTSLAKGRVVLALEDAPSQLTGAMYQSIIALIGETLFSLSPYLRPTPNTISTILEVENRIKNKWGCFPFNVKILDKLNLHGLRDDKERSEVAHEYYNKPTLKTCSHFKPKVFDLSRINLRKCASCDVKENLVFCFQCLKPFCKSFQHGHQLAHLESGHSIFFDLGGFSCVCFTCKSFLDSETIKRYKLKIQSSYY